MPAGFALHLLVSSESHVISVMYGGISRSIDCFVDLSGFNCSVCSHRPSQLFSFFSFIACLTRIELIEPLNCFTV